MGFGGEPGGASFILVAADGSEEPGAGHNNIVTPHLPWLARAALRILGGPTWGRLNPDFLGGFYRQCFA